MTQMGRQCVKRNEFWPICNTKNEKALPAGWIDMLSPGNLLNGLLGICLSLSLCACGFFAGNIAPPPASVRTHKVVRTAYAQMGKKYRSGGDSPQKGFDCSGLVWWSYGQHGVKVPRITSDQARTGKKVSKKAAQPGDIVVFRTSHSPRGLHTGIYVGEQKFIHSPSSGKSVCMDSLSQGYWRDRLISIRRVGR